MTPVVSVDVGTTRIRAARWDSTGRCVQVVNRPAPALQRHDGRAEQSVSKLVAAVERAVAHVVDDTPCIVALTSQRGTTILVDAHDQPLTPVISWQDRRPGGVAAWFAEHAPGVVERTVRQASVASVLVHGWTGQWAEHSATRAPHALGVPTADAMEPLDCTAGRFARGSVVVAVGGDKNCELFGAGATAPGHRAVSFGTALSMGTLIASDAAQARGTFRTQSALSGLDTVEVGLPAGGVMASRLGGPQSAVRLPSDDGVMCVPYFAGSLLQPTATGRFVGLTPSMDMDQLYAAWLESLVLELVFASARLGPIDGPVGLCGGAATPQFSQWLATGLQATVADRSASECGLFGAATLAMRAVGTSTAHLEPLEVRWVEPQDDTRWRRRLARYAELVGDTVMSSLA